MWSILLIWAIPSSLIELQALNHNYMSLKIQQLQLEKRFEFPKSRNIRSLLSRGHLHACSWLVFGACSFLVGIGRKFDHQAAWVFPKILSPKATIFQASKLWNQTYSYLMLSLFFVWLRNFLRRKHTNYPWNITTCWKNLRSLCRPDLQLCRHRLSECIVNYHQLPALPNIEMETFKSDVGGSTLEGKIILVPKITMAELLRSGKLSSVWQLVGGYHP